MFQQFKKEVKTKYNKHGMIEFLREHDTLYGHYANDISTNHLQIDDQTKDTIQNITKADHAFDKIQYILNQFSNQTDGNYRIEKTGAYLTLCCNRHEPKYTITIDTDRHFERLTNDQLRNTVSIVCKFDEVCDQYVQSLISFSETYTVEKQTEYIPVDHYVLVPKIQDATSESESR